MLTAIFLLIVVSAAWVWLQTRPINERTAALQVRYSNEAWRTASVSLVTTSIVVAFVAMIFNEKAPILIVAGAALYYFIRSRLQPQIAVFLPISKEWRKAQAEDHLRQLYRNLSPGNRAGIDIEVATWHKKNNKRAVGSPEELFIHMQLSQEREQ